MVLINFFISRRVPFSDVSVVDMLPYEFWLLWLKVSEVCTSKVSSSSLDVLRNKLNPYDHLRRLENSPKNRMYEIPLFKISMYTKLCICGVIYLAETVACVSSV